MVLICVLPQVASWGKGMVCTNRTKFTLIGAPDKPCGVGRADANPKTMLPNDT